MRNAPFLPVYDAEGYVIGTAIGIVLMAVVVIAMGKHLGRK